MLHILTDIQSSYFSGIDIVTCVTGFFFALTKKFLFNSLLCILQSNNMWFSLKDRHIVTFKKKITSFWQGRFQLFSCSVTLYINFPWSLGYIRKLMFGSPSLGNYFTPSLCAANILHAPRNIKLAQTLPSQGPNSYIGRVKPWRFISCAQRNSH